MTSVEQEHRIRIEDGQVIIEEFQTSDRDIVSYFEGLEESDDVGKRLEDALKIGIVAMRSIGVTGNVNYVEKAFDNMGEKMKMQIDSAFGEDGKFSGILKDHFGEDGKIIKDVLDPNREGSPLHSLRSELEGNLAAIRERLGINTAVEEAAERSPKKGIDFEDDCEKKLEWIASIHSDKLERTGNEVGRIPQSKKGDFVLILGDLGKRMVFEMKNRGVMVLPQIQRELKEAMENRGADYGIYVSKTKEALPDSVGWFNEYDGNQLVCAVENDDGGSLIDGEMIHIAYKWARAKLRMESSQEARLDPAFVIKKSSEIQTKIGEIKRIRRQCTNIENSAKEIREISKNTESEVREDLEEIMESLGSRQRSDQD